MRDVFRIVRIIDENNVVINAGKNQFLDDGDILEVFVIGDEIIDPETNESLGTLDIIKAKLEIKNLYDSMSLCCNAKTSTTNALDSASMFLRSTRLSLNVDMTQAQKLSTKSDKVIRIGDSVRKAL